MATDITRAIESAREEMNRSIGSDPTYAELMATYVELGEVLEENANLTRDSPPLEVAAFESECRALVGRLIELGRTQDSESDQRWARWWVQNTGTEREAA